MRPFSKTALELPPPLRVLKLTVSTTPQQALRARYSPAPALPPPQRREAPQSRKLATNIHHPKRKKTAESRGFCFSLQVTRN
jgi:hypothetical protein